MMDVGLWRRLQPLTVTQILRPLASYRERETEREYTATYVAKCRIKMKPSFRDPYRNVA